MGRGKRDFGNNRNFYKKKHNSEGNVDKSWQTEDRLLETEVGIEKYVNDLAGFQGVIKARFSDFHVNEIDLKNEEAIFSDFSIPKCVEAVPEDISDTIKIEDYLDDEKRKEIDDLVKGEDYHKSVLIEVTDADKEFRSNIHEIMKKMYKGKTSNNTITTGTGKKYIQIKKFKKGDRGNSGSGWQWPGEFVYFILYKENIDTLQAISLLAKNLKLKASLFNYCGTKDKRAKTAQWISVKKVEPAKIIQAAKRSQGVRVGNFKFGDKPFKLGELNGNRFQIALRSIDEGNKEIINKSCEALKENGFINYYGMQRFGNCSKIPTYEIGKALLKSDFKLAINLILKERDGEPEHMKKMRECWSNTNKASEALKFIDKRQANFVEMKILTALSKQDEEKYNYLQALQSLPRNMLMLYCHAYQSLIFNKVVSKRRELGLNVVEGDLVLKDCVNQKFETVLDEEPTNEEEDEERVAEETEETSKFVDMVKPLTKEDVESGKYTIFDIVLVLPGHDIQYPKGVIGDYYQELLQRDELSPEKFKGKQKMLSLGGAYRKVFIKPTDFKWKFMKYDNQNDNLILSDFSRLMRDPEIESKVDGKNCALILDFKLEQSCYATMLLRELLKTDTSIQTQIQLQKEINKSTVEEADGAKRKLEESGADSGSPQAKVSKQE